MFGRAKEKTPAAGASPAPRPGTAGSPAPKPGGKGRPTPSRSQAQARNRRPLVPSDRKAAQRAARESVRAARAQMQQALVTGDERFFPLRDRGPQKRLARDMVDARRNVGEYFLFVAFAALLLTFVTQAAASPWLLAVSTILIYAMAIAVLLDCILLGRRLKRAAVERFGHVERGLVGYGVSRALQIRRLRRPVPGVERGQAPR